MKSEYYPDLIIVLKKPPERFWIPERIQAHHKEKSAPERLKSLKGHYSYKDNHRKVHFQHKTKLF